MAVSECRESLEVTARSAKIKVSEAKVWISRLAVNVTEQTEQRE